MTQYNLSILYNIFIMRVHRKNRWDVTHSLTPQPHLSPLDDYKIKIPQIPEIKKVAPYVKNNANSNSNHRSRKHRLMEQRNTEIQKTNRMLYEKIRKIMQKGHSSEKKIQSEAENEDSHGNHQFLATSIKPLSLPQVRSNTSFLRSTQSQLNTILDDRPKFAEKYFEELAIARQNLVNIHTQQIGDFLCFGWKVKVLLLNHGQFLVLRAKKGKKQLTKKYIYQKVKPKINGNLEQWVSSKFQFQI